jgi:plastocyanin
MRTLTRDLQRVGLASILCIPALVASCGGGDGGRPALPTPTGGGATPAGTTKPVSTPDETPTESTGDESASEGDPASKPSGSNPVDPTQLGSIKGFATFTGTPPKRRPITAIANTSGCKDHPDTPMTETVIVNGGKVQNVFVYISRGLSDWEPTPVSSEPVMLDQKGCLYQPHVVGLRAGQTLLARNSDAISHNVHVMATKNDDPNKTQGAGSKPLEITLKREEVPVTLVCDIHPWMKAYACVVDHPFFAVTGADGSFSIAGVPPGEYTLTAWHESLKKVKVKVTVDPFSEVVVDFPFVPK